MKIRNNTKLDKWAQGHYWILLGLEFIALAISLGLINSVFWTSFTAIMILVFHRIKRGNKSKENFNKGIVGIVILLLCSLILLLLKEYILLWITLSLTIACIVYVLRRKSN